MFVFNGKRYCSNNTLTNERFVFNGKRHCSNNTLTNVQFSVLLRMLDKQTRQVVLE